MSHARTSFFTTISRSYNFFHDVITTVLSPSGNLVPPLRLRLKFATGNFRREGEEFLDYLVKLANLRPSDAVLDVGCGIGRVAVALTQFMSGAGRYEGMDIVPDAINWCRLNI